ncbi:AraC family transcriptional regulator [Algoriphagus sp. AGSA1]|uniref:helix-turn-helix domain-containing protein n=1 Tax=Algoriphagus sp. AGSA1 TaxID=2907213 RepID=UPI001F1BC932|nr:AraC family transcriptional regulator [Algoriphagus sp. AGSA1]MCE7053861.1 AraC family transcriptional regulator [Algoriphagus sp. AGSA1]
MKYQVIMPEDRLSSLVQNFWTLEINNKESTTYELISAADITSGIISQQAKFQGNGIANGKGKVLPKTFIYGLQTRPAKYVVQAQTSLVGVVFKPQGLNNLFKIPAVHATNRIISLKIINNEISRFDLFRALPTLERLACIQSFLRSRIDNNLVLEQTFSRVISHIQHQPELFSVTELKDLLGISTRQLERKFNHFIGVSPGLYLRVLKFKKAIGLIKSGKYEKFSDIAYSLNYTDQSHFIKEIRFFSGLNPKKLSRYHSPQFDELGIPVSLINAPV